MENAGEKAKTPALAVGDGFQRTEAESLDSAENVAPGLSGAGAVRQSWAQLGPNPDVRSEDGRGQRRPAGHAPDPRAIPPGASCGDCGWWRKCSSLIASLTGAESACDFAPSRFMSRTEMMACLYRPRASFTIDTGAP